MTRSSVLGTPTWLAERIAAANRVARLEPCRRCGEGVWVGLDEDVMATSTQADTLPLTPREEIRAALHERPTYALIPGRGGPALHFREDWVIGREGPYPVLVQHRCSANPRRNP